GDMDSEKVSDVEGKNECDTYFKWTMEMDGLMLEVLKEQKNKGQKEDRAFSAESYRKVVEKINEKFSVSINKSKVLNRLKTLKEQMVLAKEINQKSGIGWNDTTKTPDVWKYLCSANPKFKAIRGKHLYHLEILKEIYDKDIANRMRVETGKQKVRRWEKEDTHVNIDDIDEMQVNNEMHLENFNPFEYESMPASPTSQAPPSSIPSVSNTSSAKGKKRKVAIIDEYSQDMKDMTMAMKDIANAIISSHPKVWKTYDMREALTKLGLQGRSFCEALEWLVTHPTLLGVFFGLPEELRLEWLREKMDFEF
ncbi:hypothetical protein HN873_071430, partial [Arachis hypogaea]